MLPTRTAGTASMQMLRRLARTPVATSTAIACTYRGVAAYPVPRSQNRTRRPKKLYNYLTSERLVRTPRQLRSRAALRNRDDHALNRRRHYREELLQDIDSKIKYLSPEAKRHVFFPPAHHEKSRRMFRGNRVLPTRTFTRVYVSVIDELCKRKNREALLEQMKKIDVEPPTTKEFHEFSDAKTGSINLPLVYSAWMERYFVELDKKYVKACGADGTFDTESPYLNTVHALILTHLGDEAKVPSLIGWSHAKGPMQSDEFVDSKRRRTTVAVALTEGRTEVYQWGRSQVEAQVAPLSVAEQADMLNATRAKLETLFAHVHKKHLFAAKVMLAINSLPEVMAMQAPSRVFLTEKQLRAVVQNNGAYFPKCKYTLKHWRALSPEEQQEYYCFKKRAETTAVSGLQLYTRYCTRDYGISRAEGARRFAQLSDMQKAALNFPFYYPITPKNASNVAYRKFFNTMCHRYGLTKSNSSGNFGNHTFDAAMRQKWKLMPAHERQQYFDNDSILAAFPLLPTKETGSYTAARAEEAPDSGADEGNSLLGANDTDSAAKPPELDDVLKRARTAQRKAAAATRKKRKSGKRTTKAAARSKTRQTKSRISHKRRGLFVYSNRPAKIPRTSGVERAAAEARDAAGVPTGSFATAKTHAVKATEDAAAILV